MELPVYIILLLCGGAVARTSYYLDVVLHSHLPQENKNSSIDPIHLANFTTESGDRITFINVKVKMAYYGGLMSGLLKVRRAGDCSPVRSENGNYTLNCSIIFNEVNFDYQAKMKYGQLPTATVKAHGKMSPTHAAVEITSDKGKLPYLKHLGISKTGNIEAKFTGLGPLNSQLEKLTEKAFIGHLIGEFSKVFSNKFLPTMARVVSRVPMPIH